MVGPVEMRCNASVAGKKGVGNAIIVEDETHVASIAQEIPKVWGGVVDGRG